MSITFSNYYKSHPIYAVRPNKLYLNSPLHLVSYYKSHPIYAVMALVHSKRKRWKCQCQYVFFKTLQFSTNKKQSHLGAVTDFTCGPTNFFFVIR